jgi:magnesium and cobalt transporter
MNEDSPSSSGSAHQRSWLERLGQAFSGEPRNREELIEELRHARENGLLDGDTLAMLEGALSVSDKQVADVMVPRAQMVWVPIDASLKDVLKIVTESGHSRYPVHGEDKDEVLGLLLAKDLLRHYASGEADFELRRVLRPMTLIPETKKLNVLLKEFRLNRTHMAVVVDEYGGVAGLITIEDVLEEIVGEIDDEHDAEDKPEVHITAQPDGSWTVQALTPVEDFNAHFRVDFDTDAADTVGGLVTQAFGHLPERGEAVDLGGFRFEVAKADARRLHLLRVRPVAA